MLFIIKIFILILLISSIYSYIEFPLNIDDKNISSTDTPYEIITKLLVSKMYIIIKIGSEKINVKSYLILNRAEFMISGKDIKYHKYNELNSKSYNCSDCLIKNYYYGYFSQGIKSFEDLYIKNDKNEENIIHNMKFILGIKSNENEPPEAVIGLHLPYHDSDPDYNFIVSLKKANATNSYYWFLNFDNESKMIIDGFPHDINNKKYNADKFITTNALYNGYIIIWGLTFSNIYYDNINLNISQTLKKATIQFNNGLIIAPEEIGTFLGKEFFGEYFEKNICFKETFGNLNEIFIYCKNVKEFDVKKFKSIYFKSVDLNSIFELNYKDLFYYKDNYVYFLLLFKGISWTFGELFLKKYYLVFNQDLKTIGYYQNIENIENIENRKNEKPDNNNENKDNFDFKINLTHILLILILLSILIVGTVLYCKKGKRKNRANELDDNYEYNESINDTKNDNN